MASTSMTIRPARATAVRVTAVTAKGSSVSRAAALPMGFGAMKALPRRQMKVMAMAEEVEEVKAPSTRKPGPLDVGGTLSGDKAAGKDAAAATLGKAKVTGLEFNDSRWVKGNWDLPQFTNAAGEVDWDAVIDAEVDRRAILEATPAALDDYRSDSLVGFDTGIIPWWAWVKRFHLPEAELVNGRAAMIGYFSSYVVDLFTGVGLVDQTSSFLGKLMIFLTVCGVVFVRKTEDVDNLKGLLDEATFYDRQWQATWDGTERPSETDFSLHRCIIA